jgi:hypothetical protein
MKKLTAVLGLVLLLAACSQQPNPTNTPTNTTLDIQLTGGESLGGSIVGALQNADYSAPQIVANSARKPFVAFNNNKNVFVRTWNGTSWQSAGALRNSSSAVASSPDLAVSLSDSLFATWVEGPGPSYGNGDIYVKQRVSNTWTQLGSKLNTLPARDPAIALDANGVPYVAFGQGEVFNEATNDLVVKAFKNGSWQTVGGPLDVNTLFEKRAPSIVIDNNGYPVVAWQEWNMNAAGDVLSYVKRWNGSSWQILGSTGVFNLIHDLAISSTGTLYIARTTYGSQVTNRDDLYVERWNGRNWISLGGDYLNSILDGVTDAALEIDPTGKPVVSFTEFGLVLCVKRFENGAWKYISRALNRERGVDFRPYTIAYAPDVFINSQGYVFASWKEDITVPGQFSDVGLNIYATNLGK